MVQTRRQSRGASDAPTKETLSRTSPVNPRKRKVEADETPPTSSVKRSRFGPKKSDLNEGEYYVAGSGHAETAQPQKETEGEREKTQRKKRAGAVTEAARLTPMTPPRARPGREAMPESAQSAKSWIEIEPGSTPSRADVSVVIEKRDPLEIAPEGGDEVKVKKPKKAKKSQKPVAVEEAQPAPDEGETKVGDFGDAGIRKAAHIRFGSEEPGNQPIVGDREDEIPAEKDLGGDADVQESDEAPEAESLDTGRQKAHAAALETVKAKERQDKAVREKRRRRDEVLRAQAASSKRKQQKRTDAKHDEPSEDAALEEAAVHGNPKNTTFDPSSLPDLLPDELLATEPTIHLPSPPAESKSNKAMLPSSRKHTLFEPPAEKKPKDVRKGSVKVRVLDNPPQHLPPKMGKTSQLTKQAWLLGAKSRRGDVGRGGGRAKGSFSGIERRPMRGGLFRR